MYIKNKKPVQVSQLVKTKFKANLVSTKKESLIFKWTLCSRVYSTENGCYKHVRTHYERRYRCDCSAICDTTWTNHSEFFYLHLSKLPRSQGIRTLFGNSHTHFREKHKYVENLNVPHRALIHHWYYYVDNYGIAQTFFPFTTKKLIPCILYLPFEQHIEVN